MKNLGIGVAIGIVIGVLMLALFKTLLVIAIVGLAVVGAITLFFTVTKKSGSSPGG